MIATRRRKRACHSRGIHACEQVHLGVNILGLWSLGNSGWVIINIVTLIIVDVCCVVALIALIVLVVFTQKHKRLEGSLMQETNAVSLMFAATNKPQIDVSLHKIDKRHDVIERRHVAKRHANCVSSTSQRLLPPTGCPFTISLESEQESFSRDNLRVTKPPRTHIFSTSSDSFKYFRHAPGLQLQPVRMWMFFAADANWICQSLSSLTPTS